MAKQNYVINVNVVGEGNNAEQAYEDATGLLVEAAAKLHNQDVVVEANTSVWMDDPGGGGGGPCRPEYITLPVRLRRANPSASSRNDD